MNERQPKHFQKQKSNKKKNQNTDNHVQIVLLQFAAKMIERMALDQHVNMNFDGNSKIISEICGLDSV